MSISLNLVDSEMTDREKQNVLEKEHKLRRIILIHTCKSYVVFLEALQKRVGHFCFLLMFLTLH